MMIQRMIATLIPYRLMLVSSMSIPDSKWITPSHHLPSQGDPEMAAVHPETSTTIVTVKLEIV
jgi:hypothetical protein